MPMLNITFNSHIHIYIYIYIYIYIHTHTVYVCVYVCLGFLAPGFTYTSAEAKDYPASVGMKCGQHVEFPSRYCFMDMDYRYK